MSKDATAPEYDRRFSFVCPTALGVALVQAANSEMTSVNSWIRKAIAEQLSRSAKGDNELERR